MTRGRGRRGASSKEGTENPVDWVLPTPGMGQISGKASAGDSRAQTAPTPRPGRGPGAPLHPSPPATSSGGPGLRWQTQREAAVLSSAPPRPAAGTVNVFCQSCCSGETRAVPCLVTTAQGRRRCCGLEQGLWGACPGPYSPTPSSPGRRVSLLPGHPESRGHRTPL